MRRFLSMLTLLVGSISSAHAGIDDAINSATAPIASFIGMSLRPTPRTRPLRTSTGPLTRPI
jgi:hypothetical protein